VAEHLQLLNLAAGGEERRRAIDIEAELDHFRHRAARLLDTHGVRLEIESPAGEVIRAEHFHCLFQVAATNALDWLKNEEQRRIRIVVTGDEDRCEMVFSDTGPEYPASSASASSRHAS
jgi:C4-dicarboxylate-specific signal transduction histidine kinase